MKEGQMPCHITMGGWDEMKRGKNRVRVRVRVRVREPSSDATKEGEHLISSCRDVGA